MLAKSSRRSVAAAVVVALSGSAALSDEVILRSTDGTIDVRGTLLDFADGLYVINSPLGVFRFGADRVRCEGAACPVIDTTDVDFKIAGSETVGEELMPLILTGYASTLGAETDVSVGNTAFDKRVGLIDDEGFGDEFAAIEILSEGSDAGLDELLNESAEIAMTSRRIARRERSAFADAGYGDMSDPSQERVVAVDSIRVVVSPENPVDVISIEDLARVYSGEITNWSEIGGVDSPIAVYSRAEGTGTRTLLNRRVLRAIRADHTPDAIFVNGNVEMAKAVVADPNAIGYVGYAFERGTKTLALADTCGFRTLPNDFTSKTEEYPLERRLYIYNRNGPKSEHVEGLLNYAGSEDVDGLVAKAGFVDLGIVRREQSAIADRLRQELEATTDAFEISVLEKLYADLQNWDRLSATFRFATGSSQLDNKAQRDLERLRNYISLNPGSDIAVVGFTDSDGTAAGNLRLAQRRADQVAAELRSVAGDLLSTERLRVKAYGELAPAACNETFQGKAINRRVEIWISRQG